MAAEPGVVYVSTLDHPDESGLPYTTVAESHGYAVLQLAGHPDDLLPLVATALHDRRIVSAALVSGILTDDRLWWVHEWHHALVVDRALRWLGTSTWREDRDYRRAPVRVLRLVQDDDGEPPAGVHEPPAAVRHVETTAEFRESLTGPEPVVIEMARDTASPDDRHLFGDLADARVGGAVALLTLSGATPRSTHVRLRNPAALDLELIDDARSLSRQRRLGTISVRSVGVADGPNVRNALSGFREPERLARLWTHRPGSHRTSSSSRRTRGWIPSCMSRSARSSSRSR
jgi:hypothetical protein